MLDSAIRPLITPLTDFIGKSLVRAEIPANVVTVSGFCFAIGTFVSLVLHFYGPALVLLIINRCIDGIDGATARHTPGGKTDLGGFLDIVMDMIFYAGFVFFFAMGRHEVLLPAAFLLFSFIGSGSSFLAYAVIAEKHGLKTNKNGEKSFFHLGGLMEGTETIIAFILMCLFPEKFTLIAVLFGILCWLTAIGRIRMAIRDFKGREIDGIKL